MRLTKEKLFKIKRKIQDEWRMLEKLSYPELVTIWEKKYPNLRLELEAFSPGEKESQRSQVLVLLMKDIFDSELPDHWLW